MPASRQLCRGKMTSMVRRMIGLDLSVIDPGRGALLFDLAALWPLTRALDAIALRDYLGGSLLLGLTWVLARTGVELAGI